MRGKDAVELQHDETARAFKRFAYQIAAGHVSRGFWTVYVKYTPTSEGSGREKQREKTS
jgi:hypothetical protein